MGIEKYIKKSVFVDKKDWDKWLLLRFSAFLKDEFRANYAEIELIESYRLALYKMCESIKTDWTLCTLPKIERINTFTEPNIKVLSTYSLGIPFLFMARHLIELSLKYYLETKKDVTVTGHRISKLWAECKKETPGLSNHGYDDFIDAISALDDDELNFRYTKDKNGKEYKNEPISIDYRKIYFMTNQLSLVLVPKIKTQ